MATKLQQAEAQLTKLEAVMAGGDTLRDHFPLGPGCGPRAMSFGRQIEAARQMQALRPQVEKMRQAVERRELLVRRIADLEVKQAEAKGVRGQAERRAAIASLLRDYRLELATANRALEPA